MPMPHLTLVLGGARSGKSRLAEKIAGSTGLHKTYIATGEPLDDEMQARIAAHREFRGDDWLTIEAPQDLPGALRQAPSGHVCVVDCLTLWASNRLLTGQDALQDCDALIAALAAAKCTIICVSNEIGMGLVPDTPMGRQFRDIQGRLNQAVADVAGTVIFIAAGLPLVLKGRLPDGAT